VPPPVLLLKLVMDGGGGTAIGGALLSLTMDGGGNKYFQNVNNNAFQVLQQAITSFSNSTGGGTGSSFSGSTTGGTGPGFSNTTGGGKGSGFSASSTGGKQTSFGLAANGLPSVGGFVVLDGGGNFAETGYATSVSMTGGSNFYEQTLSDPSYDNTYVIQLIEQTATAFSNTTTGGTGTHFSGTSQGGSGPGFNTSTTGGQGSSFSGSSTGGPNTSYNLIVNGLSSVGGPVSVDGGNSTAIGSAYLDLSMNGGGNTFLQNVTSAAYQVLQQGINLFSSSTTGGQGSHFSNTTQGGSGPGFSNTTGGGKGSGFNVTATDLAALGGFVSLDGGNNQAQSALLINLTMTGGNNFYQQSLSDLNDTANNPVALIEQAISLLGAGSGTTTTTATPPTGQTTGYTSTVSGVLSLGGSITLDGGSGTAHTGAFQNLLMDGSSNSFTQVLDTNTLAVLNAVIANAGASLATLSQNQTRYGGTVNLDGGNSTATGSLLLAINMNDGGNLYTGAVDATAGPFVTSEFQNLLLPAGALGAFADVVTMTGGHNTAQAGPLTVANLSGGFDSFFEQFNLDANNLLPSSSLAMANTLINSFTGANQATVVAQLGPQVVMGNGDDVVVGGLFGNFQTGSGNNRLVIEDPNLLGAPNVATALLVYGGSFTGGTGANTYYFVGTHLGNVAINQAASTSNDTLDFSGYVADPTNPVTGISINLGSTSPQQVATNLTLTLSDGQGFNNVVGSAGSDTITGNGRAGQLLAAAPVDDRGANAPKLTGPTQVVFLDFNSFTFDANNQPIPGKHIYSAQEQSQILAQIQANYALFPFVSVTLTKPTSGPYATLFFNKTPVVNGKSEPGGLADGVDLFNENQSDTAAIDVNGLIGGTGEPAPQFTDANGNLVDSYMVMSATIGSHELAHLFGIEHNDATMIGFGVHNPPGAGKYRPPYPGPVGAWETPQHIIASPVTVGSNLFDAVAHPYFGAREAIKLAYAGGGGSIIDDTQNQAPTHNRLQLAQQITLAPLDVPNSQTQGFYANKVFSVSAVAVVDDITLDPQTNMSESNFYSFTGRAGDSMNFEVISQILSRVTTPIDSVLRIYDAGGNLVQSYYNTPAMNDDGFETGDAKIMDFTLPTTGTYYVEVDTFTDPTIPPGAPGYTQEEHDDTATGNYVLLINRFSAGNQTVPGVVDTIVGQSPTDTTTAVADAGSPQFVLTDSHLTGTNINLVNVHNAVLTGSSSGTTFDLSSWTGNATLIGLGGVNTVILNPNGTYTPTSTGFTYVINGVTRTLTLQNIQNITTPATGVNLGSLSSFTLAEGSTPASQTITFTAPGLATDYTASINWGDGEIDPLTISGSNGTYSVVAAKTAKYSDDGTYPISLTVSTTAGPVALSIASATVTESDLTVTAAAPVTVTEGQSFTGQLLATFSDSSALASDAFTAIIDWGDGSTADSVGTVTFSGGTGQVTGSHTYQEEGSHQITVIVTENGMVSANDQSAPTTVTINDATLTPGTFTPPSATEGVPTGMQTLATFTDSSTNPDINDFTATLTWGDGKVDKATAANGGIIATSSGFSVLGGHTYNEEGPQNFSVSIADVGGATPLLFSTTLTVADPTLTATAKTITAAEGAPVTKVLVATFTDADPNGTVSDYVASINWGDGDTTASYTITPDATVTGQFDVVATKTTAYAEEGTKSVTVTISDIGDGRTITSPGISVGTANSTAQVGDAALTPISDSLYGLVEGASYSGVVGSFSDADPGATASDFTALVKWGDGSTTTVTSTLSGGAQIVANGSNFDVKATHTYGEEHGYNITIVVTDNGDGRTTLDPTDSTTTINSTANVSDASLTPSNKVITPVEGASFTGAVATFSDADPNATASDFTALLKWGDGGTSTVTSTLGTDGSQIVVSGSTFTVIATHSYAEEGSQPITVTIIDNGDGRSLTNASDAQATANSTANIADASLNLAMATITATEGASFSGTVATFTDQGGAEPGDYTASIDWGDKQVDSVPAASITLGGDGKTFSIPGTHTYADEGPYTVKVTVHHDALSPDTTASTSITLANATPTVGAITGASAGIPGQTLSYSSSFTDAPGDSDTAVWNWGDNLLTTQSVAATSGTRNVSASHVYAAAATYTVTLQVTDDDGTTVTSSSFTVTVTNSTMLLDATASRALTASGKSQINVPGPLLIDSNSSSALYATDTAKITATTIQIVGGASINGKATVSPTPKTGIAPFSDPLSNLTGPSTNGLPNNGSVSFKDNAKHTIQPGIYGYINVGGNATVTMQPGIYVIEGYGMTVNGNGSLIGNGVTIYNTNSNYPLTGGTTTGITVGGNASISLTAATTSANGAYPGVVIYQGRSNTRALSISGLFGIGNPPPASLTVTGTIYVPTAQVAVSGNASLNGAVVADSLSVTSGGVSTQVSQDGTTVITDTATAGTLLSGDIYVYVNDPAGYFTANELNRIQDAITTWNTLLSPYNVTIYETTDPTQANMVLDNNTTSAAGSYSDGVLGSFTEGEITMVQGWNWYDGSDPTQIATDQYDFQTVVTHELGHALGLSGNSDPNSPMNELLAPGVTFRNPSVSDLELRAAPDGADPERAALPPPRLVTGNLPLPSVPDNAAVTAQTPANLRQETGTLPAVVTTVLQREMADKPALDSGAPARQSPSAPSGPAGILSAAMPGTVIEVSAYATMARRARASEQLFGAARDRGVPGQAALAPIPAFPATNEWFTESGDRLAVAKMSPPAFVRVEDPFAGRTLADNAVMVDPDEFTAAVLMIAAVVSGPAMVQERTARDRLFAGLVDEREDGDKSGSE
jgi:hypothetical protein